MEPQKYENETRKILISAAIISVFTFLYVPRYGRINEKLKTKMRRRSVEYWPSKSLAPPSLNFENEAGHPIIG